MRWGSARTGTGETELSAASLRRTRPPGRRPGASGARGLLGACLGPGALPAGAEGVNRSARGEAGSGARAEAYSLAHPSALISASLPGRACRGRVSEQLSRRAGRGARLLLPPPCSPLPGQPQGPLRTGRGAPGGWWRQAGLFGQEGSFLPLPPALWS